MTVFLTQAENKEVNRDNDVMSAAPVVSLPVIILPVPIRERVHFYSVEELSNTTQDH